MRAPRAWALRCMALLQSAAAGADFERLATMPVHGASHSALLAAKLLTTRLTKPVAVFGAATTAAERCKAVGAVMRTGVRAEAAPGASPGRGGALMPDSPLMAALKNKVPRSFAELMRGMKSLVELEETGAGDPAGLERREYMEQLSTMHENTPMGEDVLGAVSQRSRAAGLAEVALFSTLDKDGQRRAEEDDR